MNFPFISWFDFWDLHTVDYDDELDNDNDTYNSNPSLDKDS